MLKGLGIVGKRPVHPIQPHASRTNSGANTADCRRQEHGDSNKQRNPSSEAHGGGLLLTGDVTHAAYGVDKT